MIIHYINHPLPALGQRVRAACGITYLDHAPFTSVTEDVTCLRCRITRRFRREA